jgi:leucyl/phenylalanyl-tRNA---protein transferase
MLTWVTIQNDFFCGSLFYLAFISICCTMYFLTKELYFPSVETASAEGVLAVGGDLSVERLLLAYRSGIFPWFDPDEPILWWAPPERMVVVPETYKIPKSIRNILNKNTFRVSRNTNFKSVILHCQNIPRKGQQGTWITDDIVASYTQLHEMGHAHSFEVWQNNQLVGGLYGVDLGHVFCGESMFSLVSNASKVAFVALILYLKTHHYQLLDCQLHNEHLELLGAFEIDRSDFMQVLNSK